MDTPCEVASAVWDLYVAKWGSPIREAEFGFQRRIRVGKWVAEGVTLYATAGASASDAFNHPNFYLPQANISVPGSVGRISSMVDGAASRQVELRGRLQF